MITDERDYELKRIDLIERLKNSPNPLDHSITQIILDVLQNSSYFIAPDPTYFFCKGYDACIRDLNDPYSILS